MTVDADRRARFVTVASVAAFVLLTLSVAGSVGPLVSLDTWASGQAHAAALAHPFWRAIMLAVTVTGSLVVIGPLAALGCLVLVATGRWRQAVFVTTALIVTLSARLIPLALVARPRPVDQLAPAVNFSYPSGHTTTSATAALVLVLVCGPMLRRRRDRIVLASIAGAWAFAVGLSRVALVVHWPTDVLGGWLFTVPMVLSVGLVLRRVMSGTPDTRHAVPV